MLRISSIIAGILSLWSCHSSRTPTLYSPHRLRGVVRSSGHIATKGSIVVVTDLASSQECAVTRVNAEGTFEVEVSAIQVALAISNPKGWAYLPKVDVRGRGLDIELNRECMPFRGKIEAVGEVPPNVDLLRIGRISNDVGDTFAASLDRDLRFEACLPGAQYQVVLPSQFANRLIAASIPQQAPLSVHAVTHQAAKAAPQEPLHLEHLSQGEFVKQLPEDVRLLALAETNHGTREFTLERTSLMLALARDSAFTTVLLEAALGGVLPANAYIHGAAVDLDVAISRMGFWLWKTDELREALKAFRAYNQTVAPARQINIMGIDVQQPEGAIDDLLEGNVGLTPDEAGLLARLHDQNGLAWSKFSKRDQENTRRSLEQIAGRRDHGGLASETNRHALSARSLLFSLDFVGTSTLWDQIRTRDHASAELVAMMCDLEPGLRATMWAHLEHLSREHVVGITSLGSRLAATFGERYRAYALLAYEGSARAKDPQRMTMPAVAFPIAAAPPYALEGALVSSVPKGLSDITYWSFDDAPARRPRWLRELHWIRAFGGIYPGAERSHELYNLGAIDGAVLFKKVTPSRPLNLPAPSPPAATRSP